MDVWYIVENYLDFFIECLKWRPFSLAHKQILEWKLSATLTWATPTGGFNAAPSFFDRHDCNFQETISMTRSRF